MYNLEYRQFPPIRLKIVGSEIRKMLGSIFIISFIYWIAFKIAINALFIPLLTNGNYSYHIIKISFSKKKGSREKFPMSAASMSR